MDVKKEERCHSVEWDVSSFLVDGQLCLRYVTLAAVGLPQLAFFFSGAAFCPERESEPTTWRVGGMGHGLIYILILQETCNYAKANIILIAVSWGV